MMNDWLWIQFFSVVVRNSALRELGAPDVAATPEGWESVQSNRFLSLYSAMDFGDLEPLLQHFESAGLMHGIDFAIVDMVSGPMRPCRLMEFRAASDEPMASWQVRGATAGESISDNLVNAYKAAVFLVEDQDHKFELALDNKCAGLMQLFAAGGYQTAAFITAYNPNSGFLVFAENERRNLELLSLLNGCCPLTLRGVGHGRGKEYPSEASFLALGISAEDTLDLAKRYGQNVIVWSGSEAVPRLKLLNS